MIIPVQSQLIPAIWEGVRDLVEEAVDRGYGELDVNDVLECLLSRDMQLWVSADEEKVDAICVTEIINYRTMTACRIVLMAGKVMKNWLDDMLNVIESWSKENGVTRMEAYGRDGWVRAAKKQGYEKGYTMVIKNV